MSVLPMTAIKLQEQEAEIRTRLASVLASGVRLEVVESIPSTNAELKARALTSHQTLLLAREQTAGVGRRGSLWQSPPTGNLYLSYCVHSASPLKELGVWSLGVALAVANELEGTFSLDCKIKWPNDLYLGGKKVGGVLLETVSLPGDRIAVIIGVGLNVASHPDPELLNRPVTCLGNHVKRPIDFATVVDATARAIVEMCSLSQEALQALLASSWSSRDFLLDQQVMVPVLGAGYGIARGLSPDGGLRVEFAGKLSTVYAGEVSLGHVDAQ